MLKDATYPALQTHRNPSGARSAQDAPEGQSLFTVQADKTARNEAVVVVDSAIVDVVVAGLVLPINEISNLGNWPKIFSSHCPEIKIRSCHCPMKPNE